MSEYFPCWIGADSIIRSMIAPELGAYFSRVPYGSGSVDFSFLPSSIILLVPEEDRELFAQKCYDFYQWAFQELQLGQYFEGKLYQFLNTALIHEMSCEVERRIKEYDERDLLGFKGRFLSEMGVNPLLRIELK